MSGRGKGKSPAVFGDFIALGSKSGAVASKRDPPSSSQLTQSTSGSNPLMKKSKTSVSAGLKKTTSSTESRSNAWESIAEEVNPADLVALVEEAIEDDVDRVDALLCGAVKSLRKERAKPDQLIWLSLMYLVKTNQTVFSSSEYIRDALCSLLKRDVKESYKSKGNSLVSVSAAGILMAAYQEERQWPDIFVRVYMEDAIGERVWVDHPDCKLFVDNILTAFNTVLPAQVRGGDGSGVGACPSPPTGSSGSRTPTRGDDDIQVIELPINSEPVVEGNAGVIQRYSQQQELIELMVMNTVREQLNRRQGTDNITRNFLRFLSFACGLPELRHLAVGKLEMWLLNPKISRSAQDLLLSVTHNCSTHSHLDVEVMSTLSKLRLKTKPNINLFLASLRDLCTAHPDNLPTMMKQTIFNELSNARNTNNMAMLAVMFQTDPEKAAASLAAVFLELFLQKDCYLRALRLLLREITRCLRYDLNFPAFCLNLMVDRLKDKFEHFKDFEYKERIFCSVVDMVTLSIFLGVSNAVREGFNAYSRGEKKDMTAYKQYLQSVCTIQKNACWWMYEVVPKIYKPEPVVYTNQLYKILFMAPNLEEYYRLDNWPAESDRAFFFKITSEVPVHEDSILRIFLIGLHKSLPLNGQDCLTIAENMIKKAAGLHALTSKEFPILHCEKVKQFMECVWELTAYTYPESISLPPDYQPPSMAITGSYWKAWQLLLIISAHNPEEFGALAWDSYPTLRALMEMCITSQFVFPPPTLTTTPEKSEEVRTQELQLAQLEKQQILEFESRLAAASSKQVITEQSSLLLSTITRMDPLGPLRRPAAGVLDQLKQINSHYKLGHLLCRSRKRDFLLDILQRQGTNQAMPWLADLVESNEGSLSVLPVQCLCEFLLNDSVPDLESGQTKKRKAWELLNHLQTLLQNPETDFASCQETLDYFLRRLSSLQSQSRLQALSGLRMLVSPQAGSGGEEEMEVDNSDDSSWLLKHIPALPCFSRTYSSIAAALRQACEVESDPATVSLYIRFLSQTCPAASLPDLADLALDMAGVIVERSSLLPALLPGGSQMQMPFIDKEIQQETFQALLHVFNRYMLLVRQQDSELGWSANQDLINVLWSTRESATLHILVVHAQIILLTYGSAHSNSDLFNTLLLMWFPPGQELPRAFLVDTSEEALLIPDWLKLKMIRSSVSVLVDSALRDLEPHQLVLFIQSFGIPVDSMSKLLQTLDQAVKADLESVAESVLDKTYMGQLVAVQHRRGACGGLTFAKALGLSLDLGGPGRTGSQPLQKQLPSLSIPPRSTAMIPPSQVQTTILQLWDVGSPSRMNTKEKHDTFRTLQKYLTQELSSGVSPKMLEATVSAIQSILNSDLESPFVLALSQRSSFSCALFRILSQAVCRNPDTSLAHSLRASANRLLDKFKQMKLETPLLNLLKQFLDRVHQSERTKKKSSKELSLDSTSLEQEVKQLALESLRKENTGDLVKNLSGLLLQEQEGVQMIERGVLLDWLDLLDPTVLSTLPDLQAQLVFAKGKWSKERERSKRNNRPYLLSLLTHQASWSVLRKTVGTVLSTYREEMDPCAVLDFLTACIHIPRLWQGRDQNPAKHFQPEDVLDLSPHSVQVMGEYILKESVESGGGKESIRARIPLVLRCIDRQPRKSSALVEQLVSAVNLDRSDNLTRERGKYFLLQVYMKAPYLLEGRLHTTIGSEDMMEGESVVDLVSHTLLTALSSTQPGRDWGIKMQEFELCARKLVASHTQLFLRNLPLLSSSLQGRTQLEFPIFRSRNHLPLFTIFLGLLELARPLVFDPVHGERLEVALLSYIDMCTAYFPRRDSFYGLIDRFASFLISWISHGGKATSQASVFLSKHAGVLVQLSSASGTDKMMSLRALMSFSFNTRLEAKDLSVEQKEFPIKPAVDPLCTQLMTSSAGAMDKDTEHLYSSVIYADSIEKLANSLQDVLSASMPRPDILLHFQEELLYNITHSSATVRNVAYLCLVRLLRHVPSNWQAVLPTYLMALESGDECVAESALQKLPEFTVVCQERSDEILITVFRMGLYGRLNVNSQLTKTISLLNMQIGN